MIRKQTIYFLYFLFFPLVSCGQTNKNVEFFKGTQAFELAKAVEKGDLKRIELEINKDPNLLQINNPISGSNVLSLCLYVERFDSFNKY
jgi:hypothetical protein